MTEKKPYDSTLARMAGNIAGSLMPKDSLLDLSDAAVRYVATNSVKVARRILAELSNELTMKSADAHPAADPPQDGITFRGETRFNDACRKLLEDWCIVSPKMTWALAEFVARHVDMATKEIDLRGHGSLPESPNTADRPALIGHVLQDAPSTPNLSATWRARSALHDLGREYSKASLLKLCADELDARDAQVIAALERALVATNMVVYQEIEAALARLKGEQAS